MAMTSLRTFSFAGSLCFLLYLLLVSVNVNVDAANETFPIDQIFVIDVQDFSFDDAFDVNGIPEATAKSIVLTEFKRFFGNDVEFFDAGAEIPNLVRRLDELEFMDSDQNQDDRRLVQLPICPNYCRQKPWVARCQVDICAKSGGSRGRRFLGGGKTAEGYDHRELASGTFSFDFAAAKQAMYDALQPYARAYNIEIASDLATNEDYSNAPATWIFPIVACQPHPINGELCNFRSYFAYPDANYSSFWFIDRSDFDQTTNLVNTDYFNTVTKEEYFRAILIVERGNICRAAIERVEDNPAVCASCTICSMEDQIFSVDCSNLYADLGIEVFGKLWKGDNTTCQPAYPVFFPLITFHNWMLTA